MKALLLVLVALPAASAVDFQRDVRPILSENCFKCHGPDKETRMADMRLDTREGAFAERKNGSPVVPGKPDSSLVWQRIAQANPAMRMPPVYSHKTLTEAQKETLRAWIEAGAEWKEHWAFLAPVKRAPPPVRNEAWVRNPIDRFILARLEAQGLEPAPEADKRTLIRRVTLDITGLPPSPEEVQAFAADNSPDAYEKLVDSLMARPQWGEHRGRYWLDAARYADTHGLHIDNYRQIWPYRDWVIRAFNRNMPFDEFTIEQIAGDLLPNPTVDQLIATGFHRCNITTNEGGSIPEEVDAMYQKDRVETTSTVWLGLTAACTSCHDHKFDPLKQREFYQMVAFFKNTTQKPLDGNIPDTPPVLVLPREQDRERWQALEPKLKDREDERKAHDNRTEAAFEEWLKGDELPTLETPIRDRKEIFALPLNGEFAGTLPVGASWREGPRDDEKALEFTGNAFVDVRNAPRLDPARPFTLSIWVYFPDVLERMVVASDTDGRSRGWTLDIERQIPRFLWMDKAFGKPLFLSGDEVQRIRRNSWNHFIVLYDGKGNAELYLNTSPVPLSTATEPPPDLLARRKVSQRLRLASDGTAFLPGGALHDVQFFERAFTPDEIALLNRWDGLKTAIGKSKLSKSDREGLHFVYLYRHDALYNEWKAEVDRVNREVREIVRFGTETLVMKEDPDSKPVAHVLFRGQYDQPREEVTPGVFSVLPPMKPEWPRNRLGLAKWLVDPANPLTARVTVNRFWQEVFGTGIVRTAEDFGSMGEPPVNPELLDWLAVEFRDNGWDVKKFFRLMLTSATYRQSAITTDEKRRKDPENRLLSRGPRFRMDAEMLRDLALAASNLLVKKIGGPSVKPYQPDGIWETVAMKESNTRYYEADEGEGLHRRSMYTFWKRSAPPASMDIFNAPSRETCTVRRERTDTPLQALETMNDVQFVEAARHLAEHAVRQHGFDARLDAITLPVLSRTFDDRERAVVRAAVEDYLKDYRGGDTKTPDLAAWTLVANQILNLDEALNK